MRQFLSHRGLSPNRVRATFSVEIRLVLWRRRYRPTAHVVIDFAFPLPTSSHRRIDLDLPVPPGERAVLLRRIPCRSIFVISCRGEPMHSTPLSHRPACRRVDQHMARRHGMDGSVRDWCLDAKLIGRVSHWGRPYRTRIDGRSASSERQTEDEFKPTSGADCSDGAGSRAYFDLFRQQITRLFPYPAAPCKNGERA